MVLLPEPETPITTSAHGFSGSPTKVLRQRSLLHQPDGFADGLRATSRQVLACKGARQDCAFPGAGDLEQHFATGSQCMQGQRDAWHERLDVRLGDANHPAMDLVERRVI